MQLIQKGNPNSHPIPFMLVSSVDHISPVTGLGSAVTVTLSKNGGAFAAAAGAVTELTNGVYLLAANATDANTYGPLWLHAVGAGSDPYDIQFQVVAFNPDGISTAVSPPTTTGQLTVGDGQGTIVSGVVFTFQFVSFVTNPSGYSANTAAFTETSSGTSVNNLTVQLYQNANYKVQRGTGGFVNFATGSNSTVELPTILGSP